MSRTSRLFNQICETNSADRQQNVYLKNFGGCAIELVSGGDDAQFEIQTLPANQAVEKAANFAVQSAEVVFFVSSTD